MVLDTSAVLAILLNEPEKSNFVKTVTSAARLCISAANYVEAGIVMEARFGAAGRHQLLLFLNRAGVKIEAVDSEQADLALDGYRRFGKGNHPAGLNYGDCFSYALSVQTDEPLLYKGTDFDKTDIVHPGHKSLFDA
jgi:ribonuclease VapC